MSKNDLMPLYYAIIKHFESGKPDCAAGVITSLKSDYCGYKLFTPKDIEEALATAKENGLLDEIGYFLDSSETLQINYTISDFGLEMIKKYLD